MRWLAPLVAVVAVGGLAGCGDGRPSTEGRPSRASSSADPEVPSNVEGGIDEARGALRELDGFRCTDRGGRWHAKGAVKNASTDAGSYVVTVTLVRRKTSEVVSRQARTFVVEAGERRPFEVEFPALDVEPTAKLACVARVVRGSAATPTS